MPKIVFLGTPAFAVASLKKLHEEGVEILAVVTAPDKPAGRGLQPRTSEVKQYAVAHRLPVLQPASLKDRAFLEKIGMMNPDLMVVVAFRMMPEVLWSMPKLGTVNLHASLLPQYRGAAPIQHAIMNGETVTGVTTFFLKHEIDTGNILLREEVPVAPDETAGELHDRLMSVGARVLWETVRAIAGENYREVPQDELQVAKPLRTAPRINKEDCLIDWNRTVAEVHNFIRGLSPSPGAFSMIGPREGPAQQVKIFRAAPAEDNGMPLPGKIRCDGRTYLDVACRDGWLRVLELQMPGKKRMPVTVWLRGTRLPENWIMS